jgi:hypothetical protein
VGRTIIVGRQTCLRPAYVHLKISETYADGVNPLEAPENTPASVGDASGVDIGVTHIAAIWSRSSSDLLHVPRCRSELSLYVHTIYRVETRHNIL